MPVKQIAHCWLTGAGAVAAVGGVILSNDLTDSMLCGVYNHSLMFVLNDTVLRSRAMIKIPCHYRLLTPFNTPSERTVIVYLITRLLVIHYLNRNILAFQCKAFKAKIIRKSHREGLR